MEIIMIAAMTRHRVIGKGNELPWHIHEEFQHFKNTTKDSVVIMGKNTYNSIGKPLPRRVNIVVSKTLQDNSVTIVPSLQEALKQAKKEGEKVFLIGGRGIYEEGLGIADKMILTTIKKDYEGDVYFPEFNEDDWTLEEEEDYDEFLVKYYVRKF